METNKIYNEECIKGMQERLPDESIDCCITSPPYNVGIDYDNWDDKKSWEEYRKFMFDWLKEVYRVLKKDGRIALNIPYEINIMERGGRIFLVSEYWKVMQEIGFKFAGIVDLQEIQPHRVKLTAWGSWLSASAPYIYNPKECLIIAYKEDWKKAKVGKSYFTDNNKKEFQNLVYGMWKYQAETKGLTDANFSYDIPLQALKILTYEKDLVLDCFMGSGTTAECCIRLNRKYIGFEISKKYCDIMKCRTTQQRLNLEELKSQVEKK
jgi:site-specific DNA-methyltransferase (adenine-specific)